MIIGRICGTLVKGFVYRYIIIVYSFILEYKTTNIFIYKDQVNCQEKLKNYRNATLQYNVIGQMKWFSHQFLISLNLFIYLQFTRVVFLRWKLIELLGGTDYYKDEPIWSKKKMMLWCRQHGYTPLDNGKY